METHRLHFIASLTIFMVVLFCILRTSTVSAMEAAAAARIPSSVVNSDDSPSPLPYSDDDQEEVHQEPPFNNPITLLDPIFNNNRRLQAIWVGVVVGGLGFILLLILLCLYIGNGNGGNIADQIGSSALSQLLQPARGGGESSSSSIDDDLSNLGEVLTLEQIRVATGNFNSSNLIKYGHSGDLFRGVLENGTPVVIKRIDMLSAQKQEGYALELDLFESRGASSQPRLVSLLGNCSLDQENQRFLVYKYMPKGDLFNASAEGDGSSWSLDWITRMKIARGVAEGLYYLHHECSPPLVHRDVQASSILLDDDFEACLGSLSRVCNQEADTHQNVITRTSSGHTESSTGYQSLDEILPPISSSPILATCAYDVYCFGKILIGLVIANLHNSASDDTTTNEWLEQTLTSISKSEREPVKKIIDQTLNVDDEDLLEEVWAVAILAKSCLHGNPSKRPLMTHIRKALSNPLVEVQRAGNKSTSARLMEAIGMQLCFV